MRWQDTSRGSGQYQYRDEDDPDDPSASDQPPAVSNVERAQPLGRDELRTIRPNTYYLQVPCKIPVYYYLLHE